MPAAVRAMAPLALLSVLAAGQGRRFPPGEAPPEAALGCAPGDLSGLWWAEAATR